MTTLANLRSDGAVGPVCSAETLAAIARLLKAETGITIPEGNASLVVSRLVKHLRSLGLDGFEAYLRWISAPENSADRAAMISSLTTNTTRFYREPHHFEVFLREQLGPLKARAKAGERIRMWSAGCSSGEEPYSLAATLLCHWPDIMDYDVKILATDISGPVLQTAIEAVYPRDRLEAVPADVRAVMLEGSDPKEDLVRLPRSIRNLVTVRYLNFIEAWPTRGPFQTIFCRNVAIYMEQSIQERVWQGLIDRLDHGGVLYIGHSERLPPSQSRRVSLIDQTSFQMN